MSVVTVRGGVPIAQQLTITTTGRPILLKFSTLWIKLRNQGSNVGRLYFTQDDFDGDKNFVVIPVAAAATPHGEWEGPVETTQSDTGRQHLYLRGVGGDADVELVTFQRRG